MPAAGPGPLKVTRPTLWVPELVDAGFRLILTKTGALTVKVAVADLELRVPLIAIDSFEATGVVVTTKVASVVPANTVTDDGTTAEAFEELSETTSPPLGAFAVKETVPTEPDPPTTEDGETLIFERVCAKDEAKLQTAKQAIIANLARKLGREQKRNDRFRCCIVILRLHGCGNLEDAVDYCAAN
jgi:hypothetical protein